MLEENYRQEKQQRKVLKMQIAYIPFMKQQPGMLQISNGLNSINKRLSTGNQGNAGVKFDTLNYSTITSRTGDNVILKAKTFA